jgi:Ca2+-binding EF-hand superfamily protein
VFRTLDTDGNGYLDFKEYIMANDLIAAATPEAKLRWAFKMHSIFI